MEANEGERGEKEYEAKQGEEVDKKRQESWRREKKKSGRMDEIEGEEKSEKTKRGALQWKR